MLNFSCTYLKNETFKTLEELFQFIEPSKVALVYDTNLVIYFREFYLNPKSFIKDKSDQYFIVRYLIEQTFRYDLKVLASIGVDESSRSKTDFNIIKEKQIQTDKALMFLLHINYNNLENFIRDKEPEVPIKSGGEFPDSNIGNLKVESIYQNHLIVAYSCSLKIIELFYEVEKNKIGNLEAYLEFKRFMREDIDCILGIYEIFGLHLFGGDLSFKSIIFPSTKNTINNKLHQIFNGTLDLIIPTLVNKLANHFYSESIKDLVPIFVSSDKRLSQLHSLSEVEIVLSNNEPINYFPELCQFKLNSKLKWTDNDLMKFGEISISDINNRITNKTYYNEKMNLHLIPIAEELEKKIKLYWT